MTDALTTASVLNVPIHRLTLEQALDKIDTTIQKRKHLHIGVVNAAKMVNMRRDQLLREDVLSSDLILADGASVVWASRVLGDPLPERVAGIDLMYGMLERSNQHKYRVYCFGASEEISQEVEKQIEHNYPNAIVAGRRNGYFKPEEEAAIAEDIANAKPDILFVAITSPKKENFMAKWGKKMNVPIVHGVGGSFDVMAGKVQRAPEIWQRLGLEWFYRMKQEPGRLWKRYLTTNTIFCWMVIKALFSRKTTVDSGS